MLKDSVLPSRDLQRHGSHTPSPPGTKKRGPESLLRARGTEGHMLSKYLSLAQGLHLVWASREGGAVRAGGGRTPGLGLRPRGRRWMEGGRGQPTRHAARTPPETWASFLIFSFLCWPEPAAKRGRVSSGWHCKQGVQRVTLSLDFPIVAVYETQTLDLTTCRLTEAPPFPGMQALHFTEVETEVQTGQIWDQGPLGWLGWWRTQVVDS